MKKIIKMVMLFSMILTLLVVFPAKVNAATSVLNISTVLGDSPYKRSFKVNNPTDENLSYTYVVQGTIAEGENDSGSGSVNAHSATTHTINVKSGDVTFSVKDSNDHYSASVKGMSQYNLPVYYRCGKTDLKDVSHAICSQSGGAKVSAPQSIEKNGRVYRIDGNNYREVAYGTESLTFNYKLQSRDAITSTVVSLDQDGNTLARDTFTVTEDNGGSYKVVKTLGKNGRTYNLMNKYEDISQSYNDGAKTYYVRYQLQVDSTSLPYYVNIDYKVGNTLLTRKTLTVQKGQTVTHNAPATYQAGTTTYQLKGNGNISHKFGTAQTNYTVNYEKYITNTNQPYDIEVQYIDVATGKMLKKDTQNVAVNKTVNMDIPGSLKANQTTYILSANQPKSISHKFGTAQTVYTVYFHEKDLNVVDYDVRVNYYDLTNNKILYTTTMKATDAKKLLIEVPSRYKNDGKEFVLLSGQETSTEHEFYSKRRSYTFIYRDVNDLENQNVVVLPGVTENVVATPEGTTVRVNNETGRTTINVPENETPLVVDDNGQLTPENQLPEETVPENETPLANGSQNQMPMMIGGSIIGLALISFLIFIIIKKRKENAEENIENK